MFAELLTTTQHAVSQVADAAKNFDFDDVHMHRDIRELNAGDSAEWAAGVMYAYSGQKSDVRDYLVGCSTQDARLDKRLARAYKRFGNEKYDKGNNSIQNTESRYRKSMVGCDETNEQFEAMFSAVHAFFDADGWEDTVHGYYQANKDQVDSEW